MNTIDYAGAVPAFKQAITQINGGSGDIFFGQAPTSYLFKFNNSTKAWEYIRIGVAYPLITNFGPGEDPGAIVTGTNTGTPGSSIYPARGDHVHAHGALPGGALHAAATGSVAGFVSTAKYNALASILPRADVSSIAGGGWPSARTVGVIRVSKPSPTALYVCGNNGPFPLIHGRGAGTPAGSPGPNPRPDIWSLYNTSVAISPSASGAGFIYTGVNDGATTQFRCCFDSIYVWNPSTDSAVVALEPIPDALGGSTGYSYACLSILSPSLTKAITVGLLTDHNAHTTVVRTITWTSKTTPTSILDTPFMVGAPIYLRMRAYGNQIDLQYCIQPDVNAAYWNTLASPNGYTLFGSEWAAGMCIGVGGYGYNVVNRVLVKLYSRYWA